MSDFVNGTLELSAPLGSNQPLPAAAAPEANPFTPSPVPQDQLTDPEKYQAVLDKKNKADPGFLDTAGAALSSEWSIFGPEMSPDQAEHFSPDPNFNLQKLTPDQSKALRDGVDPALYGEYDGAVNFNHALAIRQRIDNFTKAHQTLTDAGWTGSILQTAAMFTDPATLALMATGEGEAMSLSRMLVESGGKSLTRTGKIIYDGAKSVAIVGASRIPFVENDPFQDTTDALKMAGFAFLLGGTIGAFTGDKFAEPMAKAGKAALDGTSVDLSTPAANSASLSAASAERVNLYQSSPTEERIAMWAKDRANAKTKNNLPGLGGDLLPVGTGGETLGQMDYASSIIGAAHDGIAAIGRLLVRNPSGRTFQPETAWEMAARLADTHIIDVETQKVVSFKAWADDNGYNLVTRNFPETRKVFDDLVDRATRTPGFGEDANIAAAAKAQSEGYARLLELKKAEGIKGYDKVEFNPNYVPRDYNLERMQSLEAKYGSATFDRFLTNALRSGSDELTDEEADAIVQTAKRTILRGGYQMDRTIGNSIARSDIEKIRDAVVEELKASGNTAHAENPEFIDSITGLLRNSEDRGLASNAKRRIQFDETYSQGVTPAKLGKTGQLAEEGLSFMDLLHNNATQNFEHYARGAGGEVALARILGTKSQGELDTLIQGLKEADTTYYSADKAGQDLRRVEHANLDSMFRAVQGRSLDKNPESYRWLKDALSTLRTYNFTRVMGSAGFAMMSDMGKTLWSAGFANAMRSAPMLGSIIRNARNGQWDSQFLNEITGLTGAGADRLLAIPTANSVKDIGHLDVSSGLKGLAKATADISGMTGVIMLMERLAVGAAVQNFGQMALKGEAAGWGEKRLAMLGLSPPRVRAILDEMKQHSVFAPSMFGNKVADINTDLWHPENREAFAGALRRHMRQAVHKNDPGDMMPFMTNAMGQTLFQFKSFMASAWAKHTINGLHMRDSYAINSFLGSIFFGTIGYAANTYTTALGRADKDEYLKANLSPAKLALMGFERTGYASITPSVVDTIAPLLGLPEQFANVSTTGLSRGMSKSFFDSSPTADLMSKTFDAGKGLVNAAVPGRQMSQSQFKALARIAPLSTFMGIKGGINAMAEHFPKSDGTTP